MIVEQIDGSNYSAYIGAIGAVLNEMNIAPITFRAQEICRPLVWC